MNQLVETVQGSTVATYEYDKRGNVAEVEENGDTKQTFVFDSTNKMSKVVTYKDNTSGSGTRESVTTKYAYDGAGNRVNTKVELNGSVTSNTIYVVDGESSYNDIIMAKDSVSGKTSIFTFSDEVISVETSGNISYYRNDEKHSVTDILDTAGKVKATIEYDEYGVIANPEVVSTGGNIFAYTGHVYEESTGLYYAKARYYDAESGRFVSEDSYKGEKGEILSHNLYIYGYNNPSRYLDFSGHNVKDFIRGMADTLDDNIFFGFVKWIFKKAFGKGKYQWKNELHYYGGRIVGDVISMIHGFSQFCKAVTKIVGSLIGGGAITVGSGGMLSVGGVSVAIAGVTAGAVEVTYGSKVITKSASNLGNDVKRFAELSKEKPNSTKSYIKHDTYNQIRNKLGKEAADKFTDAMNKGLVSGSGDSGIKLLSGKGAKVGNKYYRYEIKIKGKFGDYRVYGNFDSKFGQIVFDNFARGVGH